jgi:hypothetical protein
MVRSQPKQIVQRPYLKKSFTKIGLVEWLKMKALIQAPTTTKKEKRKRDLS